MVQLNYNREHGNKNEKPFEETSIYNKAELTCPHCPECGENVRVEVEERSCPYCGFKPSKHTSYNAERYDREILGLGVVFSEYRVKGKRRRKMGSRELDKEAEDYMEECGDDLLVK